MLQGQKQEYKQGLEGQKGPESKSRGSKPASSGLGLKDK